MATLYLHIGHGKTGTSWIQSSLRLSRKELLAHKILYATGPDVNIHDSTSISSGNAKGLLKSKSIFESTLSKHKPADGVSLLFSSESIFKQMIKSNAEDYIESIALHNGFDKVKILLFIRNPISLAVSVWQQRIKRKGIYNIPLAELNQHLELGIVKVFDVYKLLNQFSNLNSTELIVRNYSHCKNNLLEELALWLGVPSKTIQIPTVSCINRSMTYSELIMQQALNRVLGPSGKLLSDQLCKQLPDITPTSIHPPLKVQKAIWEEISPTIKRINKLIPKAQQYQCDIQEPRPLPEHINFSENQINLIAESLGGEILRLRKELKNSNLNTKNFK